MPAKDMVAALHDTVAKLVVQLGVLVQVLFVSLHPLF
jgi:hypothetical protein